MYYYLLLLLSLSAAFATNCRTPTGIDTSNYNQFGLQALFDIPFGGVFDIFGGIALGPLGARETPIQFRLIQHLNLGIYNSMSSYEEHALDHFGRAPESAARRFCQPGATVEEIAAFRSHRLASLAYSLYFGTRNFLPEAAGDLKAAYESLGLDMDICETLSTCEDTSTPWGFGKLITEEIWDFSLLDGWNADGSLSRTKNKIPYSDWGVDRYEPRNSPWKLKKDKYWQPLVETDNLGYITWQSHVTPHIGQKARSFFLGDEDICQREAPKPKYDFEEESELLFQRMAALNDELKMEIESFDSKLTSIVPLTAQFMGIYGSLQNPPQVFSTDTWEFILVDSAIIASLYESTIVVWKEKVRRDSVRPPSWIQENLYNDDITTYVKGEGVRTFKGKDFESYIRIMPHAEYPSGSSCVCGAFEKVMLEFFDGVDDFATLLASPGPERLESNFTAGSSRSEPGQTPANDLSLFYNSFSEIAARCGESRLNGGLHYTASVPAGYELCNDIGTKMARMIKDLDAGVQPSSNDANFADFPHPNPLNGDKRC